MAGVVAVAAVKPLATDGVALLCPLVIAKPSRSLQKSLCGREAFYSRHAKPPVTRIPIETFFAVKEDLPVTRGNLSARILSP